MTEVSAGIFDNYNNVDIQIFKIESSGVVANVLTYGALLQSLYVPDKNGAFDDITTGFDSIDHYNQKGRKDGSIMGRFAGRISNASFTLNNQVFAQSCLKKMKKGIRAVQEQRRSAKTFDSRWPIWLPYENLDSKNNRKRSRNDLCF